MTASTWSFTSRCTLLECLNDKMTAQEASRVLGRTEAACKMAAARIGRRFEARPIQQALWQASARDAACDADGPARDEAYVRAVLKANVYGFGRVMLVNPEEALARAGRAA